MRNIRCIHLMLAMVIVSVIVLTMGTTVMANASTAQYDVDTGQAVLMAAGEISDQAQIIGHEGLVVQRMQTANVDIGNKIVVEATESSQQKAWNNDVAATARNGTTQDEESSFAQTNSDDAVKLETTRPGNGGWNDVIKWNVGADAHLSQTTHAVTSATQLE